MIWAIISSFVAYPFNSFCVTKPSSLIVLIFSIMSSISGFVTKISVSDFLTYPSSDWCFVR